MRPIFCGNFEYDARQSELERLFGKYGKVDRVDMKSGFAFIYMDDERDAEDAIRGLDRIEFGRQGRRLRVEWTKQERGGSGGRRSSGSRRSSANTRPAKTLFVINFDPIRTRTRDLEKHFEPYGKILNIRIRRNFAFIQYESQEDATKALDATNMSKLMDRVISVEYAVRDDDDRRNGHSPDRRGRDRSPDRSRDRRRSPSPYRRERGSPDYGHGGNNERRSRDGGRSPSPYQRERGSPDYGHSPKADKRSHDHGRSPSPPYQGERDRDDYSRGHSHGQGAERRSNDRGRSPSARSPSPNQRGGDSPDYGQDRSPGNRPESKDSPKYERNASPVVVVRPCHQIDLDFCSSPAVAKVEGNVRFVL
ncbi:hypothetical protein Scep_006483 [Stephania cephalantha]|uniref:RRM domain-containing protein n=1 Tax=Stephania cephalantha TaxID=152367 RepID=A0AAP0K837_9MAGN